MMRMLGRARERRRDTYSRGRPFISGETVTAGDFLCSQCGHGYEVEGGRVTNLPVCPRCQGEYWRQR